MQGTQDAPPHGLSPPPIGLTWLVWKQLRSLSEYSPFAIQVRRFLLHSHILARWIESKMSPFFPNAFSSPRKSHKDSGIVMKSVLMIKRHFVVMAMKNLGASSKTLPYPRTPLPKLAIYYPSPLNQSPTMISCNSFTDVILVFGALRALLRRSPTPQNRK